MFKKLFISIILAITFFCFFGKKQAFAQTSLINRLSGAIVLQVQAHGEAWYINPADNKKYYLGRPADALEIMKHFGIGATHAFLSKKIFADPHKGKIYLDVEDFGKAYYINPKNGTAHYLGKPLDAFNAMKLLAIGIKNNDLQQIPAGECLACGQNTNEESPGAVLNSAAKAVAAGNKTEALKYFFPALKKSAEYSIEKLNSESRKSFASILAGARETQGSTNIKKIYSNEAFFALGGKNLTIRITMEKQPDGKWLITSI
jgi:hypothetical protein